MVSKYCGSSYSENFFAYLLNSIVYKYYNDVVIRWLLRTTTHQLLFVFLCFIIIIIIVFKSILFIYLINSMDNNYNTYYCY